MGALYKGLKDIKTKALNVDKRAIKVAFTVALLFVAVWVIYLVHIRKTTERYRDVVDDFINAQTENDSEQISSQISEMCLVVSYISRTVSNITLVDMGKSVPQILAGAELAAPFENVTYVEKDGSKVYFSDGNVSTEEDLSPLLAQCDTARRYTVINNVENILASDYGFAIVAPVRKGGQVVGYLIATAPYEAVVDYSELRREIVHDEIILNEKGEIVCRINNDNTVSVTHDVPSFFDYCQSTMTAEEFSSFAIEFEECMNSEVPGKTMVNVNGEANFFVYYPVKGAEGWAIMDCYPESKIVSRTRSSEIEAIIIFSVIVIIMIIAAIQIIKYLGHERKRITELEYLDGLTGVYNRTAFVNKVDEILKENKNLPYYMICFDVVNFRIINETYGHERSDTIIQAMAKACGEAFGHNEVYGRLTADVFVALALDDGEEAERIGFLEQQVHESARDVFINHPIKIKRGRYEIKDFHESINRMIDKANIARKYVNINSNELSCVYDEKLLEDARKADEIESQMEAALENGEFKPFLQGKFNMIENHVVGAEALVRWIKPDGKVVPPGDFIPLFEQNGFVEKIDFYILEEICKYLRRMIDENREVYKVSVNQSRYLLNDPEYVSKVKAILLKYQIPVGLIELELTETVFFHEKDRMIQMMNELKNMNVNLSIDDFGSGYSSFNILKDVPFDVLKIDREFLTDSVHTEKGKLILSKIVDMAHGLGMDVICEGVENEEQIALLTSINCFYAQGFYYARPIPMEEFIERFNHAK